LARFHQHDPRGFDPSHHRVKGMYVRPVFQVQERIVGLAYDADFQRDATGNVVETPHSGLNFSCPHAG
jgi:hypothetical protein